VTDKLKQQLLAFLSAVIVVAGAVTVTIIATTNDQGKPEIRVVVGAAPGAAKPIEQAPAEPTTADQSSPLRDEAPAGTTVAKSPDAQQKAINTSQTAAANTTTGPDVIPENTTLAAPHQRGCLTRSVRNYSSRNGGRPALLVAHFTVSPNRPGWSDVDAVVGLFNNPRAQASSNYVVDNEGHCKYIVPETQKAWTQAFFNPWSISIEQINTGHEPTYAGVRGLRKIGLIFSDAGKRWGIPLRAGRVGNCRVLRSGIVQHKQLGGCGGGHVDIAPYPVSRIVTAARHARCKSRKTARSRRSCLRALR